MVTYSNLTLLQTCFDWEELLLHSTKLKWDCLAEKKLMYKEKE